MLGAAEARRERGQGGGEAGEQGERQVEVQDGARGVHDLPGRAERPRVGVGRGEGQLLVVAEVDHGVPHDEVPGGAEPGGEDDGEVEQEPGAERGAGEAPRRRGTRPRFVRPDRHGREHAERGERPELQPPGRADADQRPRERGAALEGEQRAEGEGQGDRVGVRSAREGHRERGREPREHRRGTGRRAIRQPPGEQRDGRVGEHPDDPPHEERGAEEIPQPGQQIRLARWVEPPEVGVGRLAAGDPPGRLEHEPLVVRLDALEHRRRRQDGGAEEQEDGQPAPAHASGGPAALDIPGRGRST